MMPKNSLEALRQHSTIVADTGDVAAVRAHRPTDATTNPSLVLKAAQQPAYRPLLEKTVRDHANTLNDQDLVNRVLVAFGCDILSIVPGRVSTEVDARLSFDTQATVAHARQLMHCYTQAGVPRERVLIKMAATWEGVQAARVLEAEGIHCNLTLLFSLVQAVACAQAKVTLISPFVGRIVDWYAAQPGWDAQAHTGADDPGVASVTRIFRYYKAHGINTQIMAASFRRAAQITALAGCDLLTISPTLLEELAQSQQPVPLALQVDTARDPEAFPNMLEDEAQFRFALNQDAMATEKLAEGIRLFAADSARLATLVQQVRVQMGA